MIPQIYKNKNNLIFKDETSFNLELIKKNGWGLKGKKISLEKQNKSDNITLIGAINKEKFFSF